MNHRAQGSLLPSDSSVRERLDLRIFEDGPPRDSLRLGEGAGGAGGGDSAGRFVTVQLKPLGDSANLFSVFSYDPSTLMTHGDPGGRYGAVPRAGYVCEWLVLDDRVTGLAVAWVNVDPGSGGLGVARKGPRNEWWKAGGRRSRDAKNGFLDSLLRIPNSFGAVPLYEEVRV